MRSPIYSRMEATTDPSGLYRYTLEREWNAIAPRIGFVMLNPSTADATSDDATIRPCINFALGQLATSRKCCHDDN